MIKTKLFSSPHLPPLILLLANILISHTFEFKLHNTHKCSILSSELSRNIKIYSFAPSTSHKILSTFHLHIITSHKSQFSHLVRCFHYFSCIHMPRILYIICFIYKKDNIMKILLFLSLQFLLL